MADSGDITLTHDEIATLWVSLGGLKSHADMAAAIAQAESGGRLGATNNNDGGSVDRGLFQINSVHGAASTYQASKNIKAAIAISAMGVNWRPWCTAWSDNACGTKGGTYLGSGASFHQFITGRYKAVDVHIETTTDGSEVIVNSKGDNIINDKARDFDEGAGGNAEPGLHVGNPLDWAKGLAKLLANLLDPLFWLLIGQGLASVALLLIGLGLMFRKDAMSLIPAGRIASMAKGAA